MYYIVRIPARIIFHRLKRWTLIFTIKVLRESLLQTAYFADLGKVTRQVLRGAQERTVLWKCLPYVEMAPIILT